MPVNGMRLRLLAFDNGHMQRPRRSTGRGAETLRTVPPAAVSHPASVHTPVEQEVVGRFDSSALAPIRPTIVLLHTLRCHRTFGRRLLPLRHWLCGNRRRMPERPCDTPCRTAHRTESWATPSLFRVTLSVTSERLLGLLDSRQSLRLRCFLRLLPTEASSLHRNYPASTVLLTSRHPIRPGLALASCQLIVTRSPLGLPVFRLVSFVGLPSPLPRQRPWRLIARTPPRHRPYPECRAGGLLHRLFRACSVFTSRYGLHDLPSRLKATLYIRGSGSFVASAAAPIATGWSESVPGRDFQPAVDQRLYTAHQHALAIRCTVLSRRSSRPKRRSCNIGSRCSI